MRDTQSNVLEFIAGCAVDADIYYLAAAIGPGHENYDPDPGPPTRMFFYQRPTEEKWFYHDLPDWQIVSTALVSAEDNGRPRRVLALDYCGQLEDLARAGTTCEYVSPEGDDFSGGLTRIRQVGGDLFCCGVSGMIYHRDKSEWKQLPTDFPPSGREECEHDEELDDFDTWLDCVGHVFEVDGVPALAEDPAAREAELRRRFQETRIRRDNSRAARALIESAVFLGAPSVNDLCGTGYGDLYAIGSDGLIAHWDGLSWAIPDPITRADLLHACRADSGSLFLVGNEATIVTGSIATRFRCVPNQISPDIDFYCACQYGEMMYIGSVCGLYTYRFGNEALERLTVGLPEELMDAAIIDISIAGDVLWVLTAWDLVRFNGARWEVIAHPDNG